jgi:TDG/mug DNA glycosylase family protein
MQGKVTGNLSAASATMSATGNTIDVERYCRMPHHTLPDVLKANLDVVFCGTAAGDESARKRAYYAGPGNRFWKTLHEVRLTPRVLEPTEFREATEYSIGFTDLAKFTSGQDGGLKPADFDAASLREKIKRYAPRILAFNGKKAGSVFLGVKSPNYGLQQESVGTTALFVLPSTSAAARKFWDVRFWAELAAAVRVQ